jgi:hypothetical protein
MSRLASSKSSRSLTTASAVVEAVGGLDCAALLTERRCMRVNKLRRLWHRLSSSISSDSSSCSGLSCCRSSV